MICDGKHQRTHIPQGKDYFKCATKAYSVLTDKNATYIENPYRTLYHKQLTFSWTP